MMGKGYYHKVNRKIMIAIAMMGVFHLSEAQHAVKPNQPVLDVTLQTRVAVNGDKNSFQVKQELQHWIPSQTAIIITDMWDKHWCKGATSRVREMAPKINEVITIARSKGVLIVHAPSDCMNFYYDYPGRQLAKQYGNNSFNRIMNMLGVQKLPRERGAEWPVDQSDGGCADDPVCRQRHAWTKQTDLIQIKDGDAISDSGDEVAGLFEARGIKNVILMGVHTNMCIIERTFGLRNMDRLGLRSVLMRDMTDAMYNPRSWPYVSHFEGLDLVIEYIEKYISPTMLSTDFTGKAPFVFAGNEK